MVGAFLFLGLLAVAGRLAVVQVIEGDEYAGLARRQYESRVALTADRGALYDRNGNLLATNSISYSFAVDPRHLKNPKRVAATFASLSGEKVDSFYRRATMRDRAFIWMKRRVSGDAITKLDALADDGLLKIKEPIRYFEYGQLGAQVIGSTDIDNNGLSGVELFYNDQLKGRDGFIVMQRDAQSRRRPDVDLPQVRPEHGSGLVLTIDINTQAIVEEELRRGVEAAGALSGTAIALDPRTGEILAIASSPSFDPNNLRNADPAAVRVRGITDTYEPGSTMKVITAAAALEEDAVDVEEMIDCEGGEFQMAGHRITDDHAVGMVTFQGALEQSSNIAFAKVASRLSAPRFYKYVRDFGFGIISGIDLPGEAEGDVKKPNQFVKGTQEFMAFGYQLSVTPLQLVCAYGALANNGVMMKPHLLKRRLDREGETVEEIEPQQIRRVVSAETATRLRDMMVGAVERGTGREARLPGLLIAGKTGTSQQLREGTYSKENYNASFVGFFPADDPKVTLLVLLDSPRNGYYGGQVAAPIFREIARRIVNASMEGSEPRTYQAAVAVDSNNRVAAAPPEGRLFLPDLRGIDQESARRIGEKSGFRVVFRGEGTFVASQEPAAGTPANARSVITLVAGSPSASMKMPDLRGLSLRRAMNILNAHRIRPRVTGSGLVRQQSPAPGSPLQGHSRTATIECR